MGDWSDESGRRIKVTPVPVPVWQLEAQLGEGPAWLPHEAALWFVDIKWGRLHRFEPGTGTKVTYDVGGMPSFVLPMEPGGLVFGSKNVLWSFDGERIGAVLATIDQPGHNRTNDATVDTRGRLWIATMDDAEVRETGTLWCYDGGAMRHVGTNSVVTNGPAVTADCRTLYHVDSGARVISRHAIDPDGRLVGSEPFVTLSPEEGNPDGIVLDSEDCLWVALWDGWGVRRYAPDGTLLLHVPFPCARVTKLAFGGPDLTTAYVTSARVGLDEAALAAQPLAGSLFSFASPVPGRMLPKVSS